MAVIRTTLVYVVDDDRILLMRRRRQPNLGLLSPPGGKLEPGETPVQGAARELIEETGLTAKRLQARGTAHHLGPAADEEWLQHLFLAGDLRGTPAGSHAEGELAWYPLAALLADRLPVPAADRIYSAGVIDAAEAPAHWRIRHRADGSVASFERRPA